MMEVCGEKKNIMWKCSHKLKYTNLELHKSNEKKVESVILKEWKCYFPFVQIYLCLSNVGIRYVNGDRVSKLSIV